MAYFEVDSAQVAQAGGAARVCVNTVRSEVNALVAHLTQLQGAWKGGAAHAFNDVLLSWQRTQVLVEQGLDQISLALDASARQYEETEAATIRMFAS